jgi:uncharacterized membrane protein YeaQ/YmgE (transglycosylase-associated protein family)
MNYIITLVIGVLVGFLANRISHTNLFTFYFIFIIGSFLGNYACGLGEMSIIGSVLGAVLSLFIYCAARKV